MTGATTRWSARGAGDGKGLPRSRAYRPRWRFEEPSGDRFGIKHTAGDARRADFRLIGLVSACNLLVEEAK